MCQLLKVTASRFLHFHVPVQSLHRTAVDWAKKWEHTDVVELLESSL